MHKDPGIPNLFPYKKEMLKKLLANGDISNEAMSKVLAE
jgi:hypothetical protein